MSHQLFTKFSQNSLTLCVSSGAIVSASDQGGWDDVSDQYLTRSSAPGSRPYSGPIISARLSNQGGRDDVSDHLTVTSGRSKVEPRTGREVPTSKSTVNLRLQGHRLQCCRIRGSLVPLTVRANELNISGSWKLILLQKLLAISSKIFAFVQMSDIVLNEFR